MDEAAARAFVWLDSRPGDPLTVTRTVGTLWKDWCDDKWFHEAGVLRSMFAIDVEAVMLADGNGGPQRRMWLDVQGLDLLVSRLRGRALEYGDGSLECEMARRLDHHYRH